MVSFIFQESRLLAKMLHMTYSSTCSEDPSRGRKGLRPLLHSTAVGAIFRYTTWRRAAGATHGGREGISRGGGEAAAGRD